MKRDLDLIREILLFVERKNTYSKGLGPKDEEKIVKLLLCLKIFEPFPLFVRIAYYEHETRQSIVPSRDAASRGPVDPQRI